MTEILLKEIEKGNFDFCDENGDILLKEDGSPKIENLGGVLWRKMQFIFSDLIKKRIRPYLGMFDEDIPHEQKYIEFLEELIATENEILKKEEFKAIRSDQRKRLKAIKTNKQFIMFLKGMQENISTKPSDSLLEKAQLNSEKVKDIIINCFKSLTKTQKIYTAFAALNFLNKDIAEIFQVKPAAITPIMQEASDRMGKCITKSGIDSF
jgi:hypothetical protein